MSYYLQIDGAEPTDFASNTGYGDVRRWVESLDAKKFDELHTLVNDGVSGKPKMLREQTAAATKAHPPKDSIVAGTLRLMQDTISAAETVVSITDGIG